MPNLHSYYLLCWPLIALHTAAAALDEASLSKQLNECVPSLVGQLESLAKKMPDCSTIQAECYSTGSQASPVLQLRCNSNGPDLAMSLSCSGENPREVLNEVIDRFCFADIDPMTETNLEFPKLVFTMKWKDFLSQIKNVKATSKPLPDKAVLVGFLLELVKNQIRDKCDTLTVICGKSARSVTEIQGSNCKAMALFTEGLDGGKFFSREKLSPKKTNPPAVAFKFKILHPEIRMEKTASVIYDLLCSTDKVKNQPFMKMSVFENAINGVTADYKIV